MGQSNGDLGEQALSKLAEVGISSQVDAVENLSVDIRTDPVKLIQGELESVEIAGQGLVVQKELRMESMSLQTGELAINPLSVMFGKIELTQPTEATAQVTLTEADINQAFNSDYIREKLQGLGLIVNTKPMAIEVQAVDFQLPGDQKIYLQADITTKLIDESPANVNLERQRVAFSAIPHVSPDRQRVELSEIEYQEGEEFSAELTEALLARTSELLDLRNFELPGMNLYLEAINVKLGTLSLLGRANIEQFSVTE
jgi:hypothetical protein